MRTPLLVCTVAALAPAGPLLAQATPPTATRACYVPASATVYLIGLGSTTPSACLAGHTEVTIGTFSLPAAVSQNTPATLLGVQNTGSGNVAAFAAASGTSLTASSATGQAVVATSGTVVSTAAFLNTSGTTGYAVHAESKGSFPTLASHNTGTTGNAIHATSNSVNPTVALQNFGSGNALSATVGSAGDVVFLRNTGAGRAVFAASKPAFPEATAVLDNIGGLALRLDGSGLVNQNLMVQGDLDINGALRVRGGVMNAIVRTSRGDTEIYSEESAEVWFTDYGAARLADGQAWVRIDPLFAETVSLDPEYHVFVQGYAPGSFYVAERTTRGFRVRIQGGAPDARFSYRIVAKRKGFEARRLDPIH